MPFPRRDQLTTPSPQLLRHSLRVHHNLAVLQKKYLRTCRTLLDATAHQYRIWPGLTTQLGWRLSAVWWGSRGRPRHHRTQPSGFCVRLCRRDTLGDRVGPGPGSGDGMGGAFAQGRGGDSWGHIALPSFNRKECVGLWKSRCFPPPGEKRI